MMNFKNTLVIIVFLLFSNKLLYALQKDTSWSKKNLSDFGIIYFGISNEMGSFHKVESYFWGFDLGMIVKPFKDKKSLLKIGIGSSWLDNSVIVDFQSSNLYLSYPINIKYGGFRLGMIFFADRIFVPSFDLLIASGDIKYQIPIDVYKTYKSVIISNKAPVYIVMPKLNFEIKIKQTLKFGWGLSYRFVNGMNVPWSKNSLASDFGYFGTFVGLFGK